MVIIAKTGKKQNSVDHKWKAFYLKQTMRLVYSTIQWNPSIVSQSCIGWERTKRCDQNAFQQLVCVYLFVFNL